MLRPNFKDDQKAFEYAIYMMVGSYFKKAVASNKRQEANRRIMYGEQRYDDQYWMEDECEEFVQKKLSKMPESLWKEEMDVSFIPLGDTKVAEVRFIGTNYVLRIAGTMQKNHVSFLEPALCKKSA